MKTALKLEKTKLYSKQICITKYILLMVSLYQGAYLIEIRNRRVKVIVP